MKRTSPVPRPHDEGIFTIPTSTLDLAAVKDIEERGAQDAGRDRTRARDSAQGVMFKTTEDGEGGGIYSRPIPAAAKQRRTSKVSTNVCKNGLCIRLCGMEELAGPKPYASDCMADGCTVIFSPGHVMSCHGAADGGPGPFFKC